MKDVSKGAYAVRIAGDGHVNGTSFTATGHGKGDAAAGTFAFDVDFSEVSPKSDPLVNVLSILIFGTGVFGQEIGGAQNLLTLAKGEFDFRHRIAGPGIITESVGKLARSGESEFTWSSSASGDVDLGKVTRIEPARVVMVPAGPGRVVETIEWCVTDRGASKRFSAFREFLFAGKVELPHLQLRDVTVVARSAERRVSLEIASTIRPYPSPAKALRAGSTR